MIQKIKANFIVPLRSPVIVDNIIFYVTDQLATVEWISHLPIFPMGNQNTKYLEFILDWIRCGQMLHYQCITLFFRWPATLLSSLCGLPPILNFRRCVSLLTFTLPFLLFLQFLVRYVLDRLLWYCWAYTRCPWFPHRIAHHSKKFQVQLRNEKYLVYSV